MVTDVPGGPLESQQAQPGFPLREHTVGNPRRPLSVKPVKSEDYFNSGLPPNLGNCDQKAGLGVPRVGNRLSRLTGMYVREGAPDRGVRGAEPPALGPRSGKNWGF